MCRICSGGCQDWDTLCSLFPEAVSLWVTRMKGPLTSLLWSLSTREGGPATLADKSPETKWSRQSPQVLHEGGPAPPPQGGCV